MILRGPPGKELPVFCAWRVGMELAYAHYVVLLPQPCKQTSQNMLFMFMLIKRNLKVHSPFYTHPLFHPPKVWSHLEPTRRLGLLTSILSSALSLAFSYASFDIKTKGFDGVVGATSYSSFVFLQAPAKSKQHWCQRSIWDWLQKALKKNKFAIAPSTG